MSTKPDWTSNIKASTVYRELSSLPSYTYAQFQASNVVRVGSSLVDHDRNVKRQNLQTFVINGPTDNDALATVATDTTDVVKSAVSPSRKLVAVLREIQDNAGSGKKRFVEVWDQSRLRTSLEVTKIHGAFYGDDIFSSLSFSPSEDSLIYIGEINADKGEDKDSSKLSLSKYEYKPSLGEGYPGKKQPGIFLFRWDPEDASVQPTVRLLRTRKEDQSQPIFFTQAVFASNQRIFTIGYEYPQDYKLLGVKFCTNRSACVWDFAIPESQGGSETEGDVIRCRATKRTPRSRSARCPRVHFEDGQPVSLIWLSNPVGGPHSSCSTVHFHNLRTEEINRDQWEGKVIVEQVFDPKPDEFPGIFTTTVPTEPFVVLKDPTGASAETFLVTTSLWRSRSVILLVSLKDGKVVNLTPDDGQHLYSWVVLTTDGRDQLIAVRGSANIPQELVLGRLRGSSGEVDWQVLAKPGLSRALRENLARLKTAVIPIPHRRPVETIVLGPQDDSPRPLITHPHGGPHGSTVTMFNVLHATLALEGYTISMPQYTGTLGFGETYVRELLGHIGSLDVEDCIETVKHLGDIGIAELGPGKQFLFGGSHGGFLTGHLIGQYPNVFSAAVLLNPVISLGEISISDIPDWYYEEAGIPFDHLSLMTPDIYAKLYQMSPIAHVDRVQSSVLLCLGESDLRVAPTQSKSYFHALKGRGKDVRMICFKEDAHGLESVEAGRAYANAALAFFNSHRN